MHLAFYMLTAKLAAPSYIRRAKLMFFANTCDVERQSEELFQQSLIRSLQGTNYKN